jgi:hypothetical protein
MRAAAKTLLLMAALCVAALAAAGPAQAAYDLKEFSVSFQAADGSAVTQAGSHPYAMVSNFAITTREEGEVIFPEGAPKDVIVTPPVGFAGNPTATPRCSGQDFAEIPQGTSLPSCANSTAIGTAALLVAQKPGLKADELTEFVVPVYNLQPAPGAALKLGFVVVGVPITLEAGLSESTPYRIVAPTTNISQAVTFFAAKLTLWGNPASSVHDTSRGNCVFPTAPTHNGEVVSKGSCGVSIPEKPFLTLPRTCSGPLVTEYATDSWAAPGKKRPNGEAELTDPNWLTGSSEAPATTGCAKVLAGFAPSFAAAPSTTAAQSPSGLNVSVTVSDPGLSDPSPAANAKSDIKRVEIAFPPGVSINPSQAEGLAACSEEDLARETLNAAPGEGCPQASKIGSLEVQTPLLEGVTLKGSLFVATPFENPTGGLIALYMVFRDREDGIIVKAPIEVALDPESGQITGIADDLPQLPFSSFRLHFSEGPRSPLITPPSCGTYTAQATFSPWAEPAATFPTSSSFTIGSCPAGAPSMHPDLTAGTINNAAGSYSPFYVRLTRRDEDQPLTALGLTLPAGVTGRIAGVAQCPASSIDAARKKNGREEQASPSCPQGSLIGHVLSGAGVGPELTYVAGSLYLGGPFEGDPLSVVAIVPAVTGPFDIGNVVVQEGLTINPETYVVEVDPSPSQPLPQILEGIPLHLRDLRISTDRPNFTLNPTSCEPEQTTGTAFGLLAQPFAIADRFQASSCASLAFHPKFSIWLKGATGRTGHPALRSTIVYPQAAGYANTARAVVILPHSAFIDQSHINNPCTMPQFEAEACPPLSVLGTARATTPLLAEPLEGNVYFRSNHGARPLPDIVVDLRGTFHVTLVGQVDSVGPPNKARIRTTFLSAPDAPVESFELKLKGGKEGLIENSAALCSVKRRAQVQLTGQNGRLSESTPVIATSCKKYKRSKRRARAA